MQVMNRRDALDDENILILKKLLVSLSIFFCSSLTISSTGKLGELTRFGKFLIPYIDSLGASLRMPEVLVYLLFGLFHTLSVSRTKKTFYSQQLVVRHYLVDIFFYSCFYKLILLPSCGFGFIEWIIITLMFAIDLGTVKQKKFYSRKNSQTINDVGLDSLVVTGFFLWMIKIFIRYMFPLDLSSELVENTTAMNYLAFMFLLAAIYGIVKVIEYFKFTDVIKVSASAGVKTGALWEMIKLLVFPPWVLLIIVGVFLLMSLGLGVYFQFRVSRLRSDILALLIPLLRFTLKSDSYASHDDILNTMGMIVSFFAFIWMVLTEKQSFNIASDESIQEDTKKKNNLKLFFNSRKTSKLVKYEDNTISIKPTVTKDKMEMDVND